MANKSEKDDSSKRHHKDHIIEFTKTLEWLITAFILAFVFRVFIMEAYRVPTGSMASTLKGDHYALRCPQCGYRFDYGFDSIGKRSGTASEVSCHCPSCGYQISTKGSVPIEKGDRILVLKCVYQFFEPKRWDVVVFKNPLEPKINYIKRLVGLPTETVEIIDGDIYINGRIARKPSKLQQQLWMPVYDNDYQPVRPAQGLFNNHLWQQPFNTSDSNWHINPDNPTVFLLDSPPEQINMMAYDTSLGNGFRATYAYNDVQAYRYRPFCSDLMVQLYVQSFNEQTCVGIELSKYGTIYRASVNPDGKMIIEKFSDGQSAEELAAKSIEMPAAEELKPVKFTNLNHLLTFQFGDEKLSVDLGRSAEDAGPREVEIEPSVKIFGSGRLALSHVAIFRDIHYTSSKYGNGRGNGRAVEGNPFKLKEDQFFVLGDNSPNSEDGRWWEKKGIANKGIGAYDAGIVPRDYLVGKALFVYWPSGYGFPWPGSLRSYLHNNSRRNGLFRLLNGIVCLNWIPNIGQMHFIYGGSNKHK